MTKIISREKTLPLGVKWSREGKSTSVTTKNNSFTSNEKPVKDQNGVRRESMAYPLDEVA